MPLNDESWAVVVICDITLLYCDTRLARVLWAVLSATGAEADVQVSVEVIVPPIVPPAAALPRVEEA